MAVGDVDPEALALAATTMLDVIVSGIEDQRDGLVQAFVQLGAGQGSRTCTAVSREGVACDRAPAHRGLCSFDFEATVRMYQGYEEQAHRVPELEGQVMQLTSQLQSAARELQEHRTKRHARGGKPPPPAPTPTDKPPAADT
jgi:hypothetical protein